MKSSTEEAQEIEEPSRVTLGRNNIEHFLDVARYVPGRTLQYDNDRAQVQRLKLPAVNIGVFGGIGAGKSCFINSLQSVISGQYGDHAGENRMMNDSEKCLNSTTAERVKIRVAEHVCLVDNRGFPKKLNEAVAEEVVKQCDGTRKFGCFVPEDWNNNHWQQAKDSICGTFRRRSLKQRVHCAILLYSLQDDVEPRDLKVLIDALRKATGRFPLIVLTYIDQVDEDMINRRWSQFQSLHCSRVFAVKNYNMHDSEPREETDKVLVDILFNCCIVSDQNFVQIMEDSGTCC